MKLFDPVNVDVKEFMHKRREIQRYHYILLCILYWIVYITLSPKDVPLLSIATTMLFTPIITFCFYYRTSSFLFNRNAFYIVYLMVTTFMYIFVMSLFVKEYENHYVSYEVAHILIGTALGFVIAVASSLPFKLSQMILLGTEFYYTTKQLEALENIAFPELNLKRKKEKYETYNETQLQVALKDAEKNEKFEEADIIKKILNRKFK